jgi:hypothetical protein
MTRTILRIDGHLTTDWDSFHTVFSHVFGFPEFYGRNMDAWIDCMTDLDDPNSGMTKVHCSPGDVIVLQVDNVNQVPSELYAALVECAAFVNWRRIDQGEPAVLALSFHRTMS